MTTGNRYIKSVLKLFFSCQGSIAPRHSLIGAHRYIVYARVRKGSEFFRTENPLVPVIFYRKFLLKKGGLTTYKLDLFLSLYKTSTDFSGKKMVLVLTLYNP